MIDGDAHAALSLINHAVRGVTMPLTLRETKALAREFTRLYQIEVDHEKLDRDVYKAHLRTEFEKYGRQFTEEIERARRTDSNTEGGKYHCAICAPWHPDPRHNDVALDDGRWVTNFARPVEEWLATNRTTGADVMWGRFPLGMVQRWMERAKEAEAKLTALSDPDAALPAPHPPRPR